MREMGGPLSLPLGDALGVLGGTDGDGEGQGLAVVAYLKSHIHTDL